jgi:hypothetical protein
LRELSARPSRQLEIEVAHHPVDDGRLLRVLLAEVGAIGADDVEQLQADGRHAPEMAGPRRPLQRSAELLDLDPGLEAVRVELLGGGCEEQVDPVLGGDRRVPRLVPWIPREVLAGAELRRVDERGGDDDVVLLPGRRDQGQMAVVEPAHGRDEPDGSPRTEPLQRRAQLGDGGDRPHRTASDSVAVASAR